MTSNRDVRRIDRIIVGCTAVRRIKATHGWASNPSSRSPAFGEFESLDLE